MNENIRIGIVGDCSNWNLNSLSVDMIPLDIRESIKNCDIFIFNLEGPIVNEKIEIGGPIKNKYIIHLLSKIGKLQPIVTNTDNILQAMNFSGTSVACLANNHILDAGKEGLNFTLKSLNENGFLLLGAGSNLAEASKPLIIEIKRKKIGILNYNFIGWRKFGHFINIFGATSKRAGANYGSKKKIIEDIHILKKQVDHLILIAHIGKESQENLSTNDSNFLEGLGVDLIITHHSHVAQFTKSKKIFSCGDFLFYYPKHLPEKRRCQMVFIEIKEEIEVYIKKIRLENGICYANEE